MMVVNAKCGWTADPRLHTVTDLKSVSADGSGLKIRFSTHRINDRRQSLLSPTAAAAHSEDVRSSALHASMLSIHC